MGSFRFQMKEIEVFEITEQSALPNPTGASHTGMPL
jgi:hypothetical protein